MRVPNENFAELSQSAAFSDSNSRGEML